MKAYLGLNEVFEKALSRSMRVGFEKEQKCMQLSPSDVSLGKSSHHFTFE